MLVGISIPYTAVADGSASPLALKSRHKEDRQFDAIPGNIGSMLRRSLLGNKIPSKVIKKRE